MPQRVSHAPTALDGAREPASKVNYGTAGVGASAGLAIAAGASVEAAASGAAGAVSSGLLQAAAAKNIETSTRSRTLRIASSLIEHVARRIETRQEYDRCRTTSSWCSQ